MGKLSTKQAEVISEKSLADKVQIISRKGANCIEFELPLDDINLKLFKQNGKEKLWVLGMSILKQFPLEKFTDDVFRALLLACNPRIFQRKGRVTDDILETLRSKKWDFEDLSHPMHLVGSIVKVGGKARIRFTGIMDGGHRIRTILKAFLDGTLKINHNIMILLHEGYENSRIHKMSKSLNNIKSLQDKTLMNYDHDFDIFGKWAPDQYKNGYDGLIRVTENQPGFRVDASDLAILLVAADPLNKKKMEAFSQRRKDIEEQFHEKNGYYDRLYPKETGVVLLKIYDYVKWYLAEHFEESYPDLVKAARANTKDLIFIDKNDMEFNCSDKSFALAIMAGIVRNKLMPRGKSGHEKLYWKSDVTKNPEKYVRQLISKIGNSAGKIMSTKRFNYKSPLWANVMNLIK